MWMVISIAQVIVTDVKAAKSVAAVSVPDPDVKVQCQCGTCCT